MDCLYLAGNTAIVTGATSGIGAQVAYDLAASGALVGVLDRDADGVAALSEKIIMAGGRAFALLADVSDRQAVQRAVERFATLESRVDILVTCAVVLDRPLLATDPATWHSVMSVNVGGTLAATEAVAPMMERNRYGRIVHLGSRVVFGDAHRTTCTVSKGATTALTKSFAMRLAPSGVTVNCVAPGLVPQPATRPGETRPGGSAAERLAGGLSVRQWGSPEDVSGAVGFLVSPRAGFVTGQVLYVCGGRSLASGPSNAVA